MTNYIRKGEYEVFELDDEWMILNSADFTVTVLNEVGGFCWSLLDSKCSVQEMIHAIQNQYDIKEMPIEEDVISFLSCLLQCGLVEKHAG
ncbi:PqqD family protein [Rossellomorea aquimaris]|uniref:Coenzyme PQQ synthesis protein D (PqqD) n=1 Tax=Rossellomorea aquimaris TaxID=189382 RepID=A0A366ELA2_9BACI|nr:PqqD family protein [Rossellomorea aquimaris]RBP03171.1 coenzyme PQQ synthesis protein D (PqqD) [Rossellomorea aquimaris]